MVSLLPTKFHEILFRSFRGVALTNCVMDRRTGQKQCLPTKVGGDINVHDNNKVTTKSLGLDKNHLEFFTNRLVMKSLAKSLVLEKYSSSNW